MAIVKSKYDGYGQIDFTETGHDSDFIATIANHTDKTLKVYISNEEAEKLEGYLAAVDAYDKKVRELKERF